MKKPKKFFGVKKSPAVKASVVVKQVVPIVESKMEKQETLGNKSVNIRELAGSRDFWLWISIGLASLLIVYFSLQLGNTFQKWERLQTQRSELISKMTIWQGIVTQYPSYTDAYFEAALVAYRLGNFGKTLDFLQKLAVVDPNFPYAKKLEMLTRIQ